MQNMIKFRRMARHLPMVIGMGVALAGAPALAADLGKVPMDREGAAAPTPWKRYGNWPKTTWDEYNTLADLTKSPPAPKEGALKQVKAPIEGDPEKGRELAFSRSRGGGCLACHIMGPKTQEMPGNVGPDLSHEGEAGRDDAFLFNQIWDPRVYNPDTSMPPWGAHGLYSEEEIYHIVAFLKSLKEDPKYKNPALDDPYKRPLPVEDRDWRDPFINPAAEAFDTGPELYTRRGPAGKSCQDCHAEPGKLFKTWAVTMPKFDPVMKKVIGVEEFVYRHAKATTGDEFLMQSPNNLIYAVYLRSLANGEKMNVDPKAPGIKEALELGNALVKAKIGQLNFACVDCHTPEKGANKWIRGQYLGEPPGQITHFPTWRTSRNEVWDIRKRLEWCNVQIRANELPPDAKEYDALEVFLSVASNGMPMESPGIRH